MTISIDLRSKNSTLKMYFYQASEVHCFNSLRSIKSNADLMGKQALQTKYTLNQRYNMPHGVVI